MLVDKFSIGDFELIPFKSVQTAAEFYGYNTTNGASTAIGYMADKVLLVLLHKNISNNNLSIHFVCDAINTAAGGTCNISIDNLPSASTVAISDDSGELVKATATTATASFGWGPPNTDGGAIQSIESMTDINVLIQSFTGLDTLRFVSATGQTYDQPLAANLSFSLNKTQKYIDGYLYLEPEPGTYSLQQTVKVTVDPTIQNVLYTTNGTAPALAKYIAYDTLTPPNPFIATVQDGKGNAVFDGGFPKWYNSKVNTAWTVFGQMDGAFKYFANMLSFIANPAKVQAGNKKVLFLGDADAAESYSIKSEAGTGFKTSFDKVCSIMGFIPTYKTRSDYGGTINIGYAELDLYCCVVFMSSVFTTVKLITDTAISNISAYREAGNGIVIITDHGSGADGFYKTGNYIAANLGVYFSGDYNRTPVQVGFLRSTYGDHPLYQNLADSEYIYAGGSESRVFISSMPSYDYNAVPNLLTATTGFITFRFLLQRVDGVLETDSHTYGVKVMAPIQFTDGNVDIYGVNSTYKKEYNLNVRLDNTSVGSTISGLIKVGTTVVGTFSGTVGEPTYTFYTGTKLLDMRNSNQIELEVQSPIRFFKTLSLPIVREPSLPLSLARLTTQINRFELASADPTDVVKKAPDKLPISKKAALSKIVSLLRDYLK